MSVLLNGLRYLVIILGLIWLAGFALTVASGSGNSTQYVLAIVWIIAISLSAYFEIKANKSKHAK